MKSVRVHHWCIFDQRTSTKVEGLLFDEVRAVISSAPENELQHWYVWHQGWGDWRSVTDIEGMCEPLQRPVEEEPPTPPYVDKSGPTSVVEEISEAALPPAPAIKESSVEIQSIEFTGSQSNTNTSDEAGGFIVRKHRRYNKRYEIECSNGDEEFRTFSKDLSVGGIFVEDSLPDWVTGYFKVRIRKPNQKHQVELTCCLVENQAPGNRTRLSILPFSNSADEKNLEMWLAA